MTEGGDGKWRDGHLALGGRVGRTVILKQPRRGQVLAFFGRQPRCVATTKARSGAHFRRREISKLGHDERLIPPARAKPFVKRKKNEVADAEAICEAAE